MGKSIWALALSTILLVSTIAFSNNAYSDEYERDLENMELCERWYPQYQAAGEDQFYRIQTSPLARDCVWLYKDPIWDYQGEDRLDILVEKHREYKEASIKAGETAREESKIGAQLESATLVDKMMQEKISELEEKIKSLEEVLAKKDAVLMEQLKVIMDLANKITSAFFERIIPSVLPF